MDEKYKVVEVAVNKLDLREGDILVLKFIEPQPMEVVARASEHIRRLLPDNVKLLVTDGRIADPTIIRRTEH